MALYFTDNVEFLQDTQILLKKTKVSEVPPQVPHKVSEEQDILEIWKDFAENPDFLEKYCFIDWEAFQAWNQNYYFMQTIGFVHGVLPMMNMIITLLILLIPLGIIWAYGLSLTKDSYMQCIKSIGGENQLFCHVLGFMDCQSCFNFKNILLISVIAAIYGFQFYYNIIHTERFFRHFYQVVGNLRKIKAFLQTTELRMKNLEDTTKDLASYSPFIKKMQCQQQVLNQTLQEMSAVLSHGSLYHDGIHMGTFMNIYYSFYSREDIQQMVHYSICLNGYLDNMENVARKLLEGKVHLADFGKGEEKEEKDGKDGKDGKEEKEYNSMENGYYPILSDNPVKNSISLDKQVILTGPNASGKTTWIKSVALNFLFSQQVGCGFYQSCKIPRPYQHFHSYMNIPDTSERDSLFEAESRRCKLILTQLETLPGQHLCIFDELFSGTNPKDATNAATSFLKYICKLPKRYQNIDFLLTTHYVDICHKMEEYNKQKDCRLVKSYQMKCLENNGKAEMTFQVIEGISEIQGAIYVLEKMEFPQEILEGAK